MKTLLRAGLSVGLTAALIGAPSSANSGPAATTAEVRLAATVLTLEGGLVGLQHVVAFTQMQLGGQLCDAPNNCQAVDYFALPLGQRFNEMGADRLIQDIAALPNDGTPITMFGHSQGGQVIYAALRRWAADPANAPDPSRVSWVSIGNPENNFGGKAATPLPADSPYQGTEVIKQYDGWADWPTDTTNLLAVANAAVGMSTTHVFGYFNVDVNDPDNIRYTPDKADGSPGNITYVFVPTKVLPLVSLTGPLVPLLNPILDPILRPRIEAAYQRPVGPVPAPTAAASPEPVVAQVQPAALASVDLVGAAPTEVQVLGNGDTDQNDEQHQSHDRGPAYRRSAESFRVDPVGDQVGATGGAATGEGVDGVEDLSGADDAGDGHEEQGGSQHRQGHVPEALPTARTVQTSGGLNLRGDGQNAGQEEQRHVPDIRPHGNRRDNRQGQSGVGQPLDAPAQQSAQSAVGGSQDPAPQHRNGQRGAHPRQHVQGAERPTARKPASQQ